MTGSRQPRKVHWRELPPAEKAAHLLATPTISDRAWTKEPRLPGEGRSDFVRRLLLVEAPESGPEAAEAEAVAEAVAVAQAVADVAEPAGVKPGYYLLNTDAGNAGDRWGPAAIGALLRVRTHRLVTVAQISKVIEPATHNVAEYQALIEGLTLARRFGVQRIRVYMDSELVVEQVNGVAAVRRDRLKELHKEARALVAQFPNIRISWVPREMNAEADQLVRDALGRRA
jgi:ribonuclease HI